MQHAKTISCDLQLPPAPEWRTSPFPGMLLGMQWGSSSNIHACNPMNQASQESHGHLHATMKHILYPLPYMCAGNVHKGQGCEQHMNKASQQQAIQSIDPSGNSLSMHS